uniref:Uncharacterized protein n=1 Tax=Globodera rostochiensis TaxID=31243 RepID=A0A914HNI1_GLORO
MSITKFDRQNTQIGQIEPNSIDQNPPLTESDQSDNAKNGDEQNDLDGCEHGASQRGNAAQITNEELFDFEMQQRFRGGGATGVYSGERGGDPVSGRRQQLSRSAQMHPTPTFFFPGSQGLRTAVVIPTSTGYHRHASGERIRQWDGLGLAASSSPTKQNRNPVRLPNPTTRANSPESEEQRDVQPCPARLQFPQGSSSLQIPVGIRRQFLRRLSQEREHTYDLAQLIAHWNPALSLAFLSREMFYSPLLA